MLGKVCGNSCLLSLGLLLVAILARRLSQAAEYSRQQSSQIEQLEKLGRAILDAPPDGSNLSACAEETRIIHVRLTSDPDLDGIHRHAHPGASVQSCSIGSLPGTGCKRKTKHFFPCRVKGCLGTLPSRSQVQSFYAQSRMWKLISRLGKSSSSCKP